MLTLQLPDGAANLGATTYSFTAISFLTAAQLTKASVRCTYLPVTA
jgi:hypothetical protein